MTMRNISALAVRLPPEFRARLEELAKENRRSMNSEVLFQLQRTIFDPLEIKKGSEVSA